MTSRLAPAGKDGDDGAQNQVQHEQDAREQGQSQKQGQGQGQGQDARAAPKPKGIAALQLRSRLVSGLLASHTKSSDAQDVSDETSSNGGKGKRKGSEMRARKYIDAQGDAWPLRADLQDGAGNADDQHRTFYDTFPFSCSAHEGIAPVVGHR